MIDLVTIHVKAGKGGSGAVSFATGRGRPIGPPDGGDGGSGGSIFVLANHHTNTLVNYRFVKNFKAQDGQRGGNNHKTGKSGDDLYLKVPPGTVIKTSVNQQPPTVVADLTDVGQQCLMVQGGGGGRGNAHLKPAKTGPSTDWQLYRRSESGQEGEEKDIVLELKLLADVGIIGLPNAGKSTLLSVLTAATPKIANYPFTTLEPNLGVMVTNLGNKSYPAHLDKDGLVLADIPGLIEGASDGKGLGHEFLRHVERTRLLLHLVSLEGQDPLADYRAIVKELSHYHQDLANKPQLVALTKTDLFDPVKITKIQRQFKKLGIDNLTISSATNQGIDGLKKRLMGFFAQEPLTTGFPR